MEFLHYPMFSYFQGFPSLTAALVRLFDLSAATPPTDDQIKTVVTAFARLAYDALGAAFYILPEQEISLGRSRSARTASRATLRLQTVWTWLGARWSTEIMDKKEYAAFDLCRLLYSAATDNRIATDYVAYQVEEVVELMPDLDITFTTENLREYEAVDEYELRDEDTADYENFDLSKFTFPVPSSHAEDKFVICQENHNDEERFVVFDICEHAFHQHHISAWAASRSEVTCPLCRAEICVRRSIEDGPGNEVVTENEDILGYYE
ncbi:hypothetical protein K458DRAFT_390235 [Lentithecium fluviatile CBS 122367]|uniref:RING-type domain-containing protein n=1 Tax=Lentithecium fluviatile CBS 122367 TaxID=1168545 RepID=A0A6G1IXV8_9PLEO|nr:hypothetical protein K458DRAFT_390235 [Lentithecium fluviatile CBS 122367]